jgi:hypothetical protein
MQRRVIFTDRAIVDFCRSTQDTNEVHDPAFMGGINKRVIVPGMFAFSSTANLAGAFLKEQGDYIQVFFNTLLSSGDFADLSASPVEGEHPEFRLSAVNHKDTLTTQDHYTRICATGAEFQSQSEGILHALPVSPEQIGMFASLTGCGDDRICRFLFSVSYASQAMFKSINEAATDVEKEIDRLINGDSKVSPFYHTLEIFIPRPFPRVNADGALSYRIHFERIRANREYIARVQCEQDGGPVYRSLYKMIGIPDHVILRMAKEIR